MLPLDVGGRARPMMTDVSEVAARQDSEEEVERKDEQPTVFDRRLCPGRDHDWWGQFPQILNARCGVKSKWCMETWSRGVVQL